MPYIGAVLTAVNSMRRTLIKVPITIGSTKHNSLRMQREKFDYTVFLLTLESNRQNTKHQRKRKEEKKFFSSKKTTMEEIVPISDVFPARH